MTKPNRIIILLGGAGDIINLLPLAKHEADAGNRISIMTRHEHCGLLSGCSYVDAIPFAGELWDLPKAIQTAKAMSDDVRCVQVRGTTDLVKQCTYLPAGQQAALTDSFQKEPYKLLGKMDVWAKGGLPVFDRRDKTREAELIKEHIPKKKNVILVSTSGNSSPVQFKRVLFELLKGRFGKQFAIVDLSKIKAQFLFDLLGLYEHAHCLIATDSAPLHLAYAVPKLPVVALTNDKPILWSGSVVRPNHIAYVRYGDFPSRGVEILDAIEGIGRTHRNGSPALVHAWSGYEVSENTEERHEAAKATWKVAYKAKGWMPAPIDLGAFGRDSKYGGNLKDESRYPFLKDVMRLTIQRAEPKDLIVLTRADTCFEPNVTELVTESYPGPLWSHRSIKRDTSETFHPVCDLFAFTREWWEQHQAEVPDVYLGMDWWSNRCLFDVIRRHGGRELTGAIYALPPQPKQTVPSKKYEQRNEDLHQKYQGQFGPIVLKQPIAKQLPTITVNRYRLGANAYNPSIARWNDKLIMSYRWHANNTLNTQLAMAEINEAGEVLNNRPINVPIGGGSYEDARLFTRGNALWLSYVDSTWPQHPPRCVTKYGKLALDTAWALTEVYQPKYGHNDGTAMEKNWLMFDHAGKLYCIYQSEPEQVLLEIQSGVVTAEHSCPGLRWKWGSIRGGTQPIPHGNHLLRFFHSGLDNEPGVYKRRYYVGAILHEAQPPFKPVAVSKEPVLWGAEDDGLSAIERSSIIHWKSKVVFPMGAIATKDGFLLSVGVNDAASALVKVTEKDLRL